MKQQKTIPDVSIIIISYNTRELLRACLASIVQAHGKSDSWEVIVVDNGSSDGSQEIVESRKSKVKSLKLIRNTKNLGFAAANNQGIRVSQGRYVLLLNSDTEVVPGVVRQLTEYMDVHHDVGAMTARVNLSDGSMDPACHRGFPTPWAAFTYFSGLERLFPVTRVFGQYHQGYKPLRKAHDVDCISGAFFLIRRSVIDQIGLLDENFFMYGEDIDWCYRIRGSGQRIVFYPDVSIVHKKHQSGLGHADYHTRSQTKKYFYDAMRLFYTKHYRHRYSLFVNFLVLLGIRIACHFRT
ncbi:MAG: glycosyltransferase family 2 protein [Candidatus Gottesmanbacteria bacterium]|nr:glycosyltransferase family 2 protein [Candidatus Gottesmanbacteria bacterium]